MPLRAKVESLITTTRVRQNFVILILPLDDFNLEITAHRVNIKNNSASTEVPT